MNQKENYPFKESENIDNNLWIGELEQWMDAKYLIESCLSYSKKYYFLIY